MKYWKIGSSILHSRIPSSYLMLTMTTTTMTMATATATAAAPWFSVATETQSKFAHFVKYEKCPQSQAISFRFNRRCWFVVFFFHSFSLLHSFLFCSPFTFLVASGERSGGASICDKRYYIGFISAESFRTQRYILQFHSNNNVPASPQLGTSFIWNQLVYQPNNI